MRLIALIIPWITLVSVKPERQINLSRPDIDSNVLLWNKMTCKSIEHKIRVTKDVKKKELYRSGLIAFKASVGITKNINHVDSTTLQYTFLQTLYDTLKEKKDFYLIEVTSMGEVNETKNFILYKNHDRSIGAVAYEFTYEAKWVRKNLYKSISFSFNNIPLRKYQVKLPNGFNLDDVIISKFVNFKVVESEYFFPGTLSWKSKLDDILQVWPNS